jgi:acetyl esterase/lipase
MSSSTRRAVLQALAAAAALGLRSSPAAEAQVKGQLTAGGIRKLSELRYVSGSRGGAQTLDLYLPALPSPKVAQAATAARPEGAAPAKGVPLLLFFHGGAWISGDKDQYGLLGLSLATQGFAVAIPNYRLAGGGGPAHPAQVQDAAQAVAWLRQHAAEHGIARDRIVVGGHSAGAYLAAMLAFAPEFLKAAGEKPEALCGFIGLEGIYDLQELATRFPSYREDFLVAAFGEPGPAWRRASPQYLAHGVQKPWLIIHSLQDELVDVDQSKRFQVALAASGVPVQYVVTPTGNHFGVVSQLALPLSPIAGQVSRFVRAVTEPL